MGSLKTLSLAGAVLVGATMVASAADLGPAPFGGPAPMGLPAAPVAAHIAETSGWYLRGDIGIAKQNFKPDLTDFRFPLTPTVGLHDRNINSVAFAGIGAGYQFNSWFRADVTAEYRTQAKFNFQDKNCFNSVTSVGTPGSPCTINAAFSGTDGINYYNGRFGAAVVLANGYIDLGNWAGFTPYVGAGVGMANRKVTGLTDRGVYQNYVTGVATSQTHTNIVPTANRTSNGLAWALMAGLAYDLGPNAKLDLGYRYLNMGKLQQSVLCPGVGSPAGTCGDYIRYKNLDSHEFKVGVRWALGGAAYAAAPAPAPMPYPAAEPRVIKKF